MAEQYEKKELRQHIYDTPDTYVGGIDKINEVLPILNDNKIVCKGDYYLLMKNRNKIRLESYGYELEPVSESLFISHKDFPANESYHSFYKLVKKSFDPMSFITN